MTDNAWTHWQTVYGLAGAMGPDAFAGVADAAQRFGTAAQQYLDATSAASATPSTIAAAAQHLSQVLRDQSTTLTGGLPWELWADVPALGLSRPQQQRTRAVSLAVRRVMDIQRRLQTLWSDTLRDAATAFAARITAPADTTLRELYDVWIDCAEAAYANTVRTPAFCDALAEFVNATSGTRAAVAAEMEAASRVQDLPSRSELNSLTKRLKEVEQQLRAARRPTTVAPRSKRPAKTTRAKRRPKA